MTRPTRPAHGFGLPTGDLIELLYFTAEDLEELHVAQAIHQDRVRCGPVDGAGPPEALFRLGRVGASHNDQIATSSGKSCRASP